MIQLRIHDESELYNPFDPTQTRIDDKVYQYLKSFCTGTEYEKHLHDTLQIITDGPVDGDRLKAAIQDAVKKDRDEFDCELALNNKRAIWAYIVGILLSAASVMFTLITDQILLALISFFGTRTISDGLTIHTRINPDIRRKKMRLDPLSDFNLEIVRNFQGGAV